MIHVLDLHFLSYEEAIASFLIPTDDGPVLVETGPYSTFPYLEKAVKAQGYELSDIKHVLLTHIHFDHAGAAWAMAKLGAKIYVHPFGGPHLAAPQKLYESARMIYGDDMERLWGDMQPIDTKLIHEIAHEEVVTIGGVSFKSLHTPGHAKHHIAWQFDDTIIAGDVAGVKIGNGPVVPPCPPPDINLEDWNDSIDLILATKPKTIYLTHFGAVENVTDHMTSLKQMLNDWAKWMKNAWQTGESAEVITPRFSAYTQGQLKKAGVSDVGLEQYEAANPSWMSVAGLIRYWKKKSS